MRIVRNPNHPRSRDGRRSKSATKQTTTAGINSVVLLSLVVISIQFGGMQPYLASMRVDWRLKLTLGNYTSVVSSAAASSAADASTAVAVASTANNISTANASTAVAPTAVASRIDSWIDSNFSFAQEKNINRDIVIQMRFPRGDRLASNVRRALYLMGYAHCYRQYFCIPEGRFGMAQYFSNGFEVCPEGLADKLDWGDRGWKSDGSLFDLAPLNKTGVYAFKRGDEGLNLWFERHQDCAFDEVSRKKWGNMIVDASLHSKHLENTTLARQELFEKTNDPKVVTVAINIRRGDQLDWGRSCILDQYYVILLRQLRSMLTKMGKSPEVHLFSEDYGMVVAAKNNLTIARNWTMYEGLVEHFHLAPDMRTSKRAHVMDVDLNLRDWRHFVSADVLVEGGSFSKIPALGRPPPDPTTGLPLTIEGYLRCSDGRNHDLRGGCRCFVGDDPVPYVNEAQLCRVSSRNVTRYPVMKRGFYPERFGLHNLPEAWEKHNTVPMETFYADLLADWNATFSSQTILNARPRRPSS